MSIKFVASCLFFLIVTNGCIERHHTAVPTQQQVSPSPEPLFNIEDADIFIG